jgi:hypothetical protein
MVWFVVYYLFGVVSFIGVRAWAEDELTLLDVVQAPVAAIVWPAVIPMELAWTRKQVVLWRRD